MISSRSLRALCEPPPSAALIADGPPPSAAPIADEPPPSAAPSAPCTAPSDAVSAPKGALSDALLLNLTLEEDRLLTSFVLLFQHDGQQSYVLFLKSGRGRVVLLGRRRGRYFARRVLFKAELCSE